MIYFHLISHNVCHIYTITERSNGPEGAGSAHTADAVGGARRRNKNMEIDIYIYIYIHLFNCSWVIIYFIFKVNKYIKCSFWVKLTTLNGILL